MHCCISWCIDDLPTNTDLHVPDQPTGLFTGGKLASQIVRDVPYALITAVLYDFLQNPHSQLHHLLRYVTRYSQSHTGKPSLPLYQNTSP
ncbi:hypothetical protein EON63_21240 [archaeon]|nr:MAG: hypothetical protein EON63_21240 [archaeon]